MTTPPTLPTQRRITAAQALLLLTVINLACYMDRYILAGITPALKAEFLPGDPDANAKAGLWSTAFLVSYMLGSPVMGWLADRRSRWLITGLSVLVWTLACGASGLAASFSGLLLTRVFLGLGEAGYGPAAPSLIADMFSPRARGRALAWFYMAIPVGSAFGYAFGGWMVHSLGWRWAFFLVVPLGLALAILSLMQKDTRAIPDKAARLTVSSTDRWKLLRIPSYLGNVAAQTAMTFAIGGLSVWAPTYIHETHGLSLAHVDLVFGGLLAAAGLAATLIGANLAEWLQTRLKGTYFWVAGCGMVLAFPMTVLLLYLPFPMAWIPVFFSMFFMFLNIGPANTALLNVTPPAMRGMAMAMNILIIHLLGDALSPWLIGWIRDRSTWEAAFLTVACMMLVAGVVWLASIPALIRDLRAARDWDADSSLTHSGH